MQISRERINGVAAATHEYTKQRLGAGATANDCWTTCARAAARLDDAFTSARRSGVPVACADGCDFCCHLRVSVFAHEASALVHHLRTRLARPEAVAAEQRILANAARIEKMTVAEHYAARIPCALLVDGRCCAYEARPSACAAHHSLSRERCEHAFQHPENHGTPKNSRPASLELQTLGDALIAATHSALAENGAAVTRSELHQSLRDLLVKSNGTDTSSATQGDSPCRSLST